jgi:hypothetical protein
VKIDEIDALLLYAALVLGAFIAATLVLAEVIL